MLPLTKPKRFIPIHDEFRMQVQHRRLDGRVALIPMNQATGHDLRAPHEFPRLLVDRDVPLSSSPRWRRVPPRRRQIEQIIEPDEWWPDDNRTDVLSAPTGAGRAITPEFGSIAVPVAVFPTRWQRTVHRESDMVEMMGNQMPNELSTKEGQIVEMRGLEPLTPAMRTRCSPS